MVTPLEPRPFIKLIPDQLGLHGPTGTTDFGHLLMIVLRTLRLRHVLIRLSVEHKGVHGALDLTGFLVARGLLESVRSRPGYKRCNVGYMNIWHILGDLAE